MTKVKLQLHEIPDLPKLMPLIRIHKELTIICGKNG